MNAKTVFISYNHGDDAVANKLKAALEDKGFIVTIDSVTMKAGAGIQQFIENAIRDADVTLSIVSNRSLLSAWVALESITAFYSEKLQSDKQFIPCYLDDDFLESEFRLNATKQINAKIDEIEKLTSKYAEEYLDTSDLNSQKTRLYQLRNNLGDILKKLKESLTLDIRDAKFDESLARIVQAIEESPSRKFPKGREYSLLAISACLLFLLILLTIILVVRNPFKPAPTTTALSPVPSPSGLTSTDNPSVSFPSRLTSTDNPSPAPSLPTTFVRVTHVDGKPVLQGGELEVRPSGEIAGILEGGGGAVWKIQAEIDQTNGDSTLPYTDKLPLTTESRGGKWSIPNADFRLIGNSDETYAEIRISLLNPSDNASLEGIAQPSVVKVKAPAPSLKIFSICGRPVGGELKSCPAHLSVKGQANNILKSKEKVYVKLSRRSDNGDSETCGYAKVANNGAWSVRSIPIGKKQAGESFRLEIGLVSDPQAESSCPQKDNSIKLWPDPR